MGPEPSNKPKAPRKVWFHPFLYVYVNWHGEAIFFFFWIFSAGLICDADEICTKSSAFACIKGWSENVCIFLVTGNQANFSLSLLHFKISCDCSEVDNAETASAQARDLLRRFNMCLSVVLVIYYIHTVFKFFVSFFLWFSFLFWSKATWRQRQNLEKKVI